MNLETMRLRGRPRNRWQDEVRDVGRIVGGKGWKERLYNSRVKQITLVWAHTENGRKQNFQKSTIYEYGNNEAER